MLLGKAKVPPSKPEESAGFSCRTPHFHGEARGIAFCTQLTRRHPAAPPKNTGLPDIAALTRAPALAGLPRARRRCTRCWTKACTALEDNQARP